jgi:hypothetical protein
VRPVIFVKYFDKGSTVLGAHQMSEALAARGIPSRVIYAHELAGIRGSTLVFIKTSRLHHLAAARLRGNRLVLDVQDTLSLKKRLKNRWLYHGVIFRSQRPLDDYANGRFRAANIYLQWNPRFQPNAVGGREFKLAYFGDPRSFELWGELPGVPCLGEDRFFAAARDYNCHISIRSPRREWLYKPTCKVSTAAACAANLITTRDEATLEVLGPDYPYYTEPDRESVLRTIGYARESFGTEVWQAGLNKMDAVKETHRLERIADRYVEFLTAIEG